MGCVRQSSRVQMCLYDLDKAFDSTEYTVLFNRLFKMGERHGGCRRAGMR